MVFALRLFWSIVTLMLGNAFFIPFLHNWLPLVLLSLLFVGMNIVPRPSRKNIKFRLKIMLGGYELLYIGFISIILQTFIIVHYIHIGLVLNLATRSTFILNTIVFVALECILLTNGFLRVLATSKRLKVVWRIVFLMFWWVPIFNIYIFVKVLHKVRSEYYFELSRLDLIESHKKNMDCKTKYPIVFVHGIFFRDWQMLNYWGRIPFALESAGAKVFYGNQQSASKISISAAELKDEIRCVLLKTGAEKVNIIAHSKGGLDARYMISKLGMSHCVASLSTINTPHRGCVWTRRMMDILPKRTIEMIENAYNSVFSVLGDTKPDFMGGVENLTDTFMEEFNKEIIDCEQVYYQSTMTTLRKPFDGTFPLNLCWFLVKKFDKEPSDGLVALSSAKWGSDYTYVSSANKNGLSHLDVIDIFHEDVNGFDVCEFYTALIKNLMGKGF